MPSPRAARARATTQGSSRHLLVNASDIYKLVYRVCTRRCSRYSRDAWKRSRSPRMGARAPAGQRLSPPLKPSHTRRRERRCKRLRYLCRLQGDYASPGVHHRRDLRILRRVLPGRAGHKHHFRRHRQGLQVCALPRALHVRHDLRGPGGGHLAVARDVPRAPRLHDPLCRCVRHVAMPVRVS